MFLLETGIYSITNKINGKVYIGQAGSKRGFAGRWKEHRTKLSKKERDKGCNAHLHAAWHLYGSENFEFAVIIRCLPLKQLLDQYEKYILREARQNGEVYNINDGGQSPLGGKMPKGRSCPANIARIIEMNKRRASKPLSMETRLKMSRAAKMRKRHATSEETKEKLRKANTGRKMTVEQIAKRIAARAGFRHSEKTRENLRKIRTELLGVGVICVENGITYASQSEAARQLGLKPHGISQCMAGKLKTTGGYRFVPIGQSYDKNKPIETAKRKPMSKEGRRIFSDLNKNGIIGFRRPHSLESRRKMSASLKGKKKSKEAIEKTAGALRGRNIPWKGRNGVAIFCITNGIFYKSIRDAARQLGIKESCCGEIGACCSGKTKQTHGFQFRYASDEIASIDCRPKNSAETTSLF